MTEAHPLYKGELCALHLNAKNRRSARAWLVGAPNGRTSPPHFLHHSVSREGVLRWAFRYDVWTHSVDLTSAHKIRRRDVI